MAGGLTRKYRQTAHVMPTLDELIQRKLEMEKLVDYLQKQLKKREAKLNRCAVCGGKFGHFIEKRDRPYNHSRMVKEIGRLEARKIRRRLWDTYGKTCTKKSKKKRLTTCPERFTYHVWVQTKRLSCRRVIDGQTIVVPVCSKNCRERQLSLDEERDRWMVQIHDNWQQVKAIREFLRTQNLGAFQSLKRGFGPVLNSPHSCRL